ncbi:Hypothetical predicted protein [Octopus vulgaris]|uniref:PH domain-containing protein n=1 Tax=Octopus vulgaris TaxID=6645 RepID=A0AA36EX29_OCTVU|nr:Hypothetical predicted protein [Octopus vulgaris]
MGKECINNVLKKFIAPKVYVVLMDCCLYYYKNERDKEPKGKYPLYGYNTVHRAGDESSNWTFVINHSDSTCKKIKFSASSQYEMVPRRNDTQPQQSLEPESIKL